MIVSKEQIIRFAEAKMTQALALLKSETEVPLNEQDKESIAMLVEAINFFDTVLCIAGVLSEETIDDIREAYRQLKEKAKARELQTLDTTSKL